MIVFALCLSLLVLILIQYILHIQNMEKHLKNLKSLPRLPLFGNVNFFLGKKLQMIYEELFAIILESGTPFKIQIGPTFLVIVNHPDDMKTVLTTAECLDRPYFYAFLHRPFSILAQRCNLYFNFEEDDLSFNATRLYLFVSFEVGSVWKPIRKLMNPMFNLKTLQSFLPIFNEKASMFVQKLENEIDKPHFDVMYYSSICTLDSVYGVYGFGTIMRINLDEQPNKGLDFLTSLEGIYEVLTKRFAVPWAHIEYIYQRTKLYKKELKCFANMRQITNEVIDTKTAAYLNRNNNTIFDESIELHKKSDFPLIPLCAEGKLNSEVAKQNIDILLVAGHETTASTISYAILMLAMHPNIQEQVFKELHSIYETQDQDTTYEMFQKFDILDRVIKETMRLFPSVYAFARTPTVDLPLRNCIVPKGVTIALPVYTLHRRRDIWGENAESFNPDNFLPENVQKRHAYAFLPFSSGSRNCIGYQYAMFTMRVMLSAILRKYKFTTNLTMSEIRPKFEVTLRLLNKHMVGIERRSW